MKKKSKGKILILGHASYGEPFKKFGYDLTVNTDMEGLHADNTALVLFTGGSDVHPMFYDGVQVQGLSFTDLGRDSYEQDMFKWCVDAGVRMTGICRGFQFLNVMCGGFMFQHINGHTGRRHAVHFPIYGRAEEVTSTHHQLVGLNPDNARVICWSKELLSDVYIGPNATVAQAPQIEAEGAVWKKHKACGVQFHPEFMDEKEEGRKIYENMMDAFLTLPTAVFADKYAVPPEGLGLTKKEDLVQPQGAVRRHVDDHNKLAQRSGGGGVARKANRS